MNSSTNCERVRIEMMAALDGEQGHDPRAGQEHLSTCAACQEWLKATRSMSDRLEGLQYEDEWNSLWPAVAARIRPADSALPLRTEVWVIAGVLAAWRALQLSLDLPVLLYTVAPLVGTAGVLWLAAANFLRIETWAPELQK